MTFGSRGVRTLPFKAANPGDPERQHQFRHPASAFLCAGGAIDCLSRAHWQILRLQFCAQALNVPLNLADRVGERAMTESFPPTYNRHTQWLIGFLVKK